MAKWMVLIGWLRTVSDRRLPEDLPLIGEKDLQKLLLSGGGPAPMCRSTSSHRVRLTSAVAPCQRPQGLAGGSGGAAERVGEQRAAVGPERLPVVLLVLLELGEAGRVEADHQVLPVGHDGGTNPSRKGPPLTKSFYILRDVQLGELAPLFPQPILDLEAIGAGGGGDQRGGHQPLQSA